jgi:hypothetical protein
LLDIASHHAKLWSDALFAYGAVILTFVGALHRGFAMTLRDLIASRRSPCSCTPRPAAFTGQYLSQPQQILSGCFGCKGNFFAMDLSEEEFRFASNPAKASKISIVR